MTLSKEQELMLEQTAVLQRAADRIRALEAQVAELKLCLTASENLRNPLYRPQSTVMGGAPIDWRTVAEELAGKLSRLHDDCCVTYKERLDVGPMFAPSEIAVLDAREALLAYNKAKAEDGR
jgi:hypothetical protein